MSFLITMALLGQVDVKIERMRVADAIFSVVVNDMVYEWERPKTWDKILSEDDATILRVMGCEHFVCREFATRKGLGNLPLIAWGRHAKDPEVASRCENLLGALLKCRHCEVCSKTVCGPSKTDDDCCFCDGTGSVAWGWSHNEGRYPDADLRIWGYRYTFGGRK